MTPSSQGQIARIKAILSATPEPVAAMAAIKVILTEVPDPAELNTIDAIKAIVAAVKDAAAPAEAADALERVKASMAAPVGAAQPASAVSTTTVDAARHAAEAFNRTEIGRALYLFLSLAVLATAIGWWIPPRSRLAGTPDQAPPAGRPTVLTTTPRL